MKRNKLQAKLKAAQGKLSQAVWETQVSIFRVANRVVCNEIEFPLEFAKKKDVE